MLIYAPLPLESVQVMLRLVLLHDCEAEAVAPGLWFLDGTRVASLLEDVCQDTRISVVQTTVEA